MANGETNGWKALCQQFRHTMEQAIERLEKRDEKQDEQVQEVDKRLRAVERQGAVAQTKIAAIVSIGVLVLGKLVELLIKYLEKKG